MKAHPKVTVQAVQISLGWGVGPQGYSLCAMRQRAELEKDSSHYSPEGGATPRSARVNGVHVS